MLIKYKSLTSRHSMRATRVCAGHNTGFTNILIGVNVFVTAATAILPLQLLSLRKHNVHANTNAQRNNGTYLVKGRTISRNEKYVNTCECAGERLNACYWSVNLRVDAG
uniref:Uncharacterized protein n=1 Tax=Glossina pallidipes TaxID=7398 RepID=A0A1A9ZGS5_GLOPL